MDSSQWALQNSEKIFFKISNPISKYWPETEISTEITHRRLRGRSCPRPPWGIPGRRSRCSCPGCCGRSGGRAASPRTRRCPGRGGCSRGAVCTPPGTSTCTLPWGPCKCGCRVSCHCPVPCTRWCLRMGIAVEKG